MASVGQEFASWQSIPGGNGSLGSLAAAYLAHKAGLIDLNDKSQMESIQKNGIGYTLASKALDKAVAPPQANQAVQAPVPAPAAPPAPAQQDAVPPVQGSSNGYGPSENLAEAEPLIDDSLPAFAAMMG
jgi:hypothetical protein